MNKEKLSSCFISIDIGGTSAKGVALNLLEKKCVRFETPSKNLRSMVELELAKLLHTVVKMIPFSEFLDESVWCIGGAGARPEVDSKRFLQLLTEIGIKKPGVAVFPDYEGNWAAAFVGNSGVISVNGTGSVLYGKNNNKSSRKGGWGYLLDETPSGAFLGRYVLQRVLYGFENTPTIINQLYEKYFPEYPRTRSGLLDILYSCSSQQSFLAQFSPIFAEAFENGDVETISFFESACNHWSEQLEALLADIEAPVDVNFCGIGGLWERWSSFGSIILESFKKRSSPFVLKVIRPEFPMEWGPIIKYFSENYISEDFWLEKLYLFKKKLFLT